MKKSKLPEKSSRTPNLFEVQRASIFKDYLDQVSQLSSESAKSQRFLLLLKDLFEEANPNFVEDYLQGVEKYVKVKKKDLLLKGRIDNLYGNLVIEFESDLGKKLSEAKEQLQKYIACLWSEEEGKTNYLCLATDGLDFQVFTPRTERLPSEPLRPEDVLLEEVDKINLSILNPNQAYFWLDRYLFRKEILRPKTEEFIKDFGIRSPALFSLLTY